MNSEQQELYETLIQAKIAQLFDLNEKPPVVIEPEPTVGDPPKDAPTSKE